MFLVLCVLLVLLVPLVLLTCSARRGDGTTVFFQVFAEFGMAAHAAIAGADFTANFFDGAQLQTRNDLNHFCFADLQTATDDLRRASFTIFRGAVPIRHRSDSNKVGMQLIETASHFNCTRAPWLVKPTTENFTGNSPVIRGLCIV